MHCTGRMQQQLKTEDPGKAAVEIVVLGTYLVKKIIQDDPDGKAAQSMYTYYQSLNGTALANKKGIVIDPGGNTIEEVLKIDN